MAPRAHTVGGGPRRWKQSPLWPHNLRQEAHGVCVRRDKLSHSLPVACVSQAVSRVPAPRRHRRRRRRPRAMQSDPRRRTSPIQSAARARVLVACCTHPVVALGAGARTESAAQERASLPARCATHTTRSFTRRPDRRPRTTNDPRRRPSRHSSGSGAARRRGAVKRARSRAAIDHADAHGPVLRHAAKDGRE